MGNGNFHPPWHTLDGMNSAMSLADFDSKWLLLADTGTVVHLWKVKDRVGYIDHSASAPNQWVWLNYDMLSRIRPCGHVELAGIQPDFRLD